MKQLSFSFVSVPRLTSLVALVCTGWLLPPAAQGEEAAWNWTAFRIRSDAAVGLNANEGWAAAENEPAQLAFDRPFRLRIEVESTRVKETLSELRLQYRKDGGVWRTVGLSAFPYPRYATPPVSLLTEAGYAMGEESEDLLHGATAEHEDGIGLVGVVATPLFHLGEGSMEWEWPLVIRRFSDGPAFHEDGSVYELRVVDDAGRALPGVGPARLELVASDGHLGGTFVETPARIGPYQTSKGTLYFIMEPTETDNRFMMVASHDGGRSWREVDGANRPTTGDLEGVGAVLADGVIHIVHQISYEVVHHAFATDDAKPIQDQWLVDSVLMARPGKPPTQVAALSIRADGRLIAAYGGATDAFLHLRSPGGEWAASGLALATPGVTGLSGVQLATDGAGTSYVAYTAADGTGWLRMLDAADSLSKPMLISDTLGVEDEENGAFLPLVAFREGGVAVFYRKVDGSLWQRDYDAEQGLTHPRLVTARPVVTCAVDADQVGADVIWYNGRFHLLFIDEATRSLFYTSAGRAGGWSTPSVVVDGIDAAWVRGSLITNAAGKTVYGFVYDAGSRGGAGMNRYAEIPLP